MLPGKILYYVAPWGVWGTHCFIYKTANIILKGNGIKTGYDFPAWRNLAFYEGLAGPDGAVMRGKLKISSMYYNPTTQRGDVLKSVVFYFHKLKQARENCQGYTYRNKKYDESFTKIATWLGHFVVDALTPPHHYGQYQKSRINLVFWNFKSDWHDPYARGILSKHTMFEYWIGFAGRKKFFGPVKLKEPLVKLFNQDDKHLVDYLVNKMGRIDELGIYQEYLKSGWSKNIQKKVNQKLIPEMASVVATIWYAALKN